MLHVIIHISLAQFPLTCMDPTSLNAKTCCPSYQKSECGSAFGRGECRTITLSNAGSSVRDQWPYYFNRVCVCASNYAGYDCGRCEYGRYGDDCENSTVLARRPISEYSVEEWKDYLEIIADTKQYMSGYKVFLTEPANVRTQQSTEITLYNLFVWQHHYSAKDSENKGNVM